MTSAPDEVPEWPEFPVSLLTDRTSKQARAAWEGFLRDARRAGWHGPFPAVPGGEIVVRHAPARDVLTDEARFAQGFMGSFRAAASLNPNVGPDLHELLEEMDACSLIDQGGERHRVLRALMGRAFTTKSVNQMRPFIRDLATRLLAGLRPGDDFMAGFARQVPSTTLCELVGVPEGDRGRCDRWTAALVPLLSSLTLLTLSAGQASEVVQARRALVDYCMALIAERRADPRDDLASRLARADDPTFDDRALAVNLADLLFGGSDNTQRALGQMLLLLMDRPDAWDAVAHDPSSAEGVVEECLRYRPPVPGPLRRTTEAARDRDADLEPGRFLLVSSHSVNHDEAAFDDASRFDPYRANARDHLSFGYGAHHCIGAGLARAEMQECLQVLTSTITCPRVSGEVVIVNQGAAGPAVLPITFERRS